MKAMAGIKRYLPVGALGISIILHLAIFLTISGIVIIQAVAPKTVFIASEQPVLSQDLPPLPEVPEDSPQVSDNTNAEEKEIPSSNLAPSIETISSNAAAVLPAFTVAPPVAVAGNGMTGIGNPASGAGTGSSGGSGIKFSPFGSSDIMAGGLEGYFYDLKQTKDGKPTGMDIPRWEKFIRGFAGSSWRPDSLRDYYKSPNPLYIQQFFIPTQLSVEGPKSFGLRDVKPDFWIALYSGTIVAPEDGDYTFCGFGDDVLLVRINGRLVLDAGWYLTMTGDKEVKTYPNQWSKVYKERGQLRIGKTFHAIAGESIKMEVLISDRGGWCAFFLFLRKEGSEYAKLSDGTPKLPVFQLRPQTVKGEGEIPPNSGKGVVWRQPK